MNSENVGIEDARKRLGDLVTAAQQDAEVVLTRNGKPAARLVGYHLEPGMIPAAVNIHDASGAIVETVTVPTMGTYWVKHDVPGLIGIVNRAPDGGAVRFADGRAVEVSCACCIQFMPLTDAFPGNEHGVMCGNCDAGEHPHSGCRYAGHDAS